MGDGLPQSHSLRVQQTQHAFDAAAPVYDTTYEGLHGIRRIRGITTELFLRYFPPNSRLLEMNCGTGNDALALARRGMRVLATDLSPRMLDEARRKARAEGLDGSITFRQLPFEQLSDLRGNSFDGAYSNLGGLNCTSQLRAVAATLADLIKPGGHLIATIMPPFCLWETAGFLARRRWHAAARRFSHKGVAAHLHGGVVQTFYHSPKQFRHACAPFFVHVETVGLCIFAPPPNFVRSSEALGSAIRWLDRADDLVKRVPLVRAMGDHYATVLRRSSE